MSSALNDLKLHSFMWSGVFFQDMCNISVHLVPFFPLQNGPWPWWPIFPAFHRYSQPVGCIKNWRCRETMGEAVIWCYNVICYIYIHTYIHTQREREDCFKRLQRQRSLGSHVHPFRRLRCETLHFRMVDAHDEVEAAVACKRNFHHTRRHDDGPIHIDRHCMKCRHLVR